MNRRIGEYPVAGLGKVWLQSLTASEGLEVEFRAIKDDGSPNPAGPAYLVAAMWLDGDTKIPRCRSVEDLEDMDYAVFQHLYDVCKRHRDYISPEELAANPTSGEVASQLTVSFSDQTRPASTDGSTISASENSANGVHSPESDSQKSAPQKSTA